MNRPEGGEGFPWNLAVAAGIGVGVERRRGETVHRAPLQVALGCAVLALGIAGAAWVAGCRRPDRTEAPGHTETTSAAGVQRYRLTGRGRARRVFEELLSEHLDGLYGYALRLCGGRNADAEDLLQDGVLRAFGGLAQLRAPEAARAWLFTIVTRTHLNRIRAARRRGEIAFTDLDEGAFERVLAEWVPANTPEEIFGRHQLRERLGRALDSLAPELRAVVWLSDVEAFRQREIAAMLDIPAGTVASRLYRARRELRERLGDEGRERAGGEKA